jgi:Secretion system C-terminal sorting domain
MKHFTLQFYIATLFIISFIHPCLSQGDTPCTAVVLTESTSLCGTFTTGTTVGAAYLANAANGGTPTCGSPSRPDVWYSFVATSSVITITTDVGSLTNAAMQIYSSSTNLCTGTLTGLICDDNSGPGLMPEISACAFTIGATYFVRIWSRGGGSGDPLTTGTFTICVYNPQGVIPVATTNCAGATLICNDAAFSGNSAGAGVNELTSCNVGCLSIEHQSSWYYFTTPTAGNLDLNITPANGTDDYDFAIWGPFSGSLPCPPTTTPLRCSWAAGGGNTGVSSTNNAPQTDLTEGSGGNRWVQTIATAAGNTYILLVDNFATSSQPFTLDWTLTAGATLGCVPLPIELTTFEANQQEAAIKLDWMTFTEMNNDYFTLEKSTDAINFEEFNRVAGTGNSTQPINYSALDKSPVVGVNYYRIKQTDYNGKFTYSDIISVRFATSQALANNVHPNPTTNIVDFDFYTAVKGELHILIMDYTGRVLIDKMELVEEGKSSIATSLTEFPAGIYSIKMEFEKTGYTFVSKIIKK